MTSSFLDELLNVSKQFFALPLEEKLKCSITEDDYFNGYGNSSLISGDTKSLNWNDRLFLKLYPQDFRQIKLWPENPNNFRYIPFLSMSELSQNRETEKRLCHFNYKLKDGVTLTIDNRF